MIRDTSAPLSFHLGQARWHVERWKERGTPAMDASSNLAYALCALAMAYAIDSKALEMHERQYFASNVAAYGHALGIYLDIDMTMAEVAAAHFNNRGAEHFDILVALGLDPSWPDFWVRYSEAVSATPQAIIELPQELLEPV